MIRERLQETDVFMVFFASKNALYFSFIIGFFSVGAAVSYAASGSSDSLTLSGSSSGSRALTLRSVRFDDLVVNMPDQIALAGSSDAGSSDAASNDTDSGDEVQETPRTPKKDRHLYLKPSREETLTENSEIQRDNDASGLTSEHRTALSALQNKLLLSEPLLSGGKKKTVQRIIRSFFKKKKANDRGTLTEEETAAIMAIATSKGLDINHGAMSHIFHSDDALSFYALRVAKSEDSPNERKNDEILKMLASKNQDFFNYFNIPIPLDLASAEESSSDLYYSLVRYLSGGSLFDKIEQLYKDAEEENKAALEANKGIFNSISIGASTADDYDHIKSVYNMTNHLLSGLDMLHDEGYAHRDIKPGNIMLTALGQPRIIDFGEIGLRSLAGSFYFQLPELIQISSTATLGSECDLKLAQQHDIYALGVSLYAYLHKGIYPLIFYKNNADIYSEDRLKVTKNFKNSSLLAVEQMSKASEIPRYAEVERVIENLSENGNSLNIDVWTIYFDRTIESFFHPTQHIDAKEAIRRLGILKQVAPEEIRSLLD